MVRARFAGTQPAVTRTWRVGNGPLSLCRGTGRIENRNVLVVSTVEHAEDELRAQVGDADTVLVVVPVVRQGVLDWLANDQRAFARAEQVAQDTADQLPGETVEAVAGEADLELAIQDALATFPADEIVIALRPDGEQGFVESKRPKARRHGAFTACPSVSS